MWLVWFCTCNGSLVFVLPLFESIRRLGVPRVGEHSRDESSAGTVTAAAAAMTSSDHDTKRAGAELLRCLKMFVTEVKPCGELPSPWEAIARSMCRTFIDAEGHPHSFAIARADAVIPHHSSEPIHTFPFGNRVPFCAGM